MAIKLVVFDFDGTIADIPAPSTWQTIDRALGCEEEDMILNQAFHSGKIDYATWSKKTVDLYKKYGMDKSRFEQIVHKHIRPMNGTKEVFDSLKKRGIKTAIVSGSILNAYDFLRGEYGLKADHVSFASEIFFDENGSVSGGNFTHLDFEGKVEAIDEICKKVGVPMSEVAMVGDGHNDIFAFRKVGLPIAFNTGDEELIKAAKFTIKENDLRKILPLI
jgi:HAD superfamily PSPase-like hydrolase